MSTRYLINRQDLSHIWRVDRETPHFWMEWRGEKDGWEGYWSRWKKQPYYDLVFDTFEEAKAEMVRRYDLRSAKARALVATGVFVCLDEEPKEATDV